MGFKRNVDFVQLVKPYSSADKGEQRGYGPAVCTGAKPTIAPCDPDWREISAWHV